MTTTRRGRRQKPVESTLPRRVLRDAARALETHGVSLETIADSDGLREQDVARVLQGEMTLLADSKLPRRMAFLLCRQALSSGEPGTKARLLAIAERFGPEVRAAGFSDAEQWFIQRAIDQVFRTEGGIRGSGFHVAPFLSEGGKLVVAALTDEAWCGCLGEITDVAGGTMQAVVSENTWDNPDWQAAEWFEASRCINAGTASDIYNHALLSEGVHVAPWKPWGSSGGCVLLAIDKRHRLVASVEIANRKDLAAALAGWKAMRLALEETLGSSADATVTLNDAARVSGYSPDHLGRLVRTGRLTNHGTKFRPLVRAGDLPRKPLTSHRRPRIVGAQ